MYIIGGDSMIKTFKKIKPDFSFVNNFTKKLFGFVKELRQESDFARKKIDRILISLALSVFFIVIASIPSIVFAILSIICFLYAFYVSFFVKEE